MIVSGQRRQHSRQQCRSDLIENLSHKGSKRWQTMSHEAAKRHNSSEESLVLWVEFSLLTVTEFGTEQHSSSIYISVAHRWRSPVEDAGKAKFTDSNLSSSIVNVIVVFYDSLNTNNATRHQDSADGREKESSSVRNVHGIMLGLFDTTPHVEIPAVVSNCSSQSSDIWNDAHTQHPSYANE